MILGCKTCENEEILNETSTSCEEVGCPVFIEYEEREMFNNRLLINGKLDEEALLDYLFEKLGV
jgi:hypothetical protein